MEMESDSDEETQINEISQLAAVLAADERPTNEHYSSQVSCSSSLCTTSSRAQDEYTRIQSALALNKLTDEKLRRLEKILIGRLHECRQKLKEIDGSAGVADRQDRTFRYINCGKPYFKGKDYFPAPDNEDTILMTKSQMYDFSNVTAVSGWTIKDKSDFLRMIHKMSIDIKKREFSSKISQLQREAKAKGIKLNKEIAAVKKELDSVKGKSLSAIALPIDQEYDWETIANKTHYRHNPQEYQALWKLFLHPSVNKSVWSRSEHMTLQRLAHSNNLQDWDKIAHDLNTGRTGYQCFVYYRTNMSNTTTGQKWTKEEEEYLKRLIDYYREDNYIPWSKVAASMENRTKIQIYNKYFRLMEQRKGRFLPEEDAVLLTCVKDFGANFKRITRYLPGRSSIQLRARYHVLSTAQRTSIVWTVDDDKKLVQLMANQDSTTNYSSLTKYFPGKERAHIRARYTTLVKWMRKNPNVDIARAPRRGARRLGHGQASLDLNAAVENLKKRIQSEVTIKRCKRISKDSPEDAIENAIIAALINENIKEEEMRKAEMLENEQYITWGGEFAIPILTSNTNNLQKTLLMLKAKLDKDKFLNSSYYNDHPSLGQMHKESCVLIKSYSKKNTVQVLQIEGKPDIWSNCLPNTSEYLFPPNYNTITGCRKLMAYVCTKPANKQVILGNLSKRNVLVKEQMALLRERFTALFLWPMILSNELPSEKNNLNQHKSRKMRRQILFSSDPGITIPAKNQTLVNKNIDLVEPEGKGNIDVEDIYVGNDDYMFMRH